MAFNANQILNEAKMKYDVFISYSSLDKQIADAICSKLENNNIRCWVAPRDILPGKEYGEAIIEAIIDCKILLLVFSVHANESPQVRREVERAVSKGKVIIPFRIEDILPTKSMEYALSNTHWLDAMTPPLESHIARLTDTIFKLLEISPPNPKPRPEPPETTFGLRIKDSSDNETILTEYGIVYNLYAEKVLSNAIRTHLIIEKGNAIQEMPWVKILKIEIPNIERAEVTLVDSKTLGSVKLRSGRLVGKDESGFLVVLDLANVHSIMTLRDKVNPVKTSTISGKENLSNETRLNLLTSGKIPNPQNTSSWMMKTTAGPGKRSSFGIVYDDKIGGIVLHGGFGSGNIISSGPDQCDTWIWKGSSWLQLKNNLGFSHGHALAFNKITQENIIFGGRSHNLFIEDTYIKSGEEWIKVDIKKEICPGARDNHALAFDEKRNSIILFGGLGMPFSNRDLHITAFPQNLDDTWEWNDSVWRKLDVNAPEPRWGHKMVFDENSGVIVLFGGFDKSKYFGDTWIWEGNTATWEKIIPVNMPLARCSHAMTYDCVRKKVLLFGGKTESGVPLNDLWEWDGNDWKLLIEHAPPKPRYNHGFVYDEKRNKSILFGGYDGKEWFQDTWEFTY